MRSSLRYYFENFIARKSNFVYFLMFASAVFAVLMIILEFSLGVIEKDSLFNLWWNRLEKLLEIEDSGSTNKERLINMLYWVFSVAFSGTIIAFLAAKVSSFIEDLKKGHSEVIDTNHYVIIGWNSTVFNVFQEIKIANENQSKPTILCFNGMNNIEMNVKIDSSWKMHWKTSSAGSICEPKIAVKASSCSYSRCSAQGAGSWQTEPSSRLNVSCSVSKTSQHTFGSVNHPQALSQRSPLLTSRAVPAPH